MSGLGLFERRAEGELATCQASPRAQISASPAEWPMYTSSGLVDFDQLTDRSLPVQLGQVNQISLRAPRKSNIFHGTGVLEAVKGVDRGNLGLCPFPFTRRVST